MKAGERGGWWREEARLCLALFAVALVLRIAAVLYINAFYSTYVFAPDSQLYDGLARSLLAGEGYAIGGDHREFTRIAPVFPVYLAILYAVFGRSVEVVGFANAVVGSLTCLIVYALARKILVRWAAALAALLVAGYWEFLFWTPFVLKETLALFLFTGALLLMSESAERRSGKVAFVSGCALGVASLARYPHVGFVPFLVGFLLSTDRARLRRLILPVVAGIVLATSPWVVRNYLVFGEVVLSSHGPARQLYITHAPGKVEDVRGYAGPEGLDLKAVDAMDRQFTSVYQRERNYLRAVLDAMASNPGGTARLVGAKVVNMWRPTWEKFRFPVRIPFAASYFLLLALGAVGLVLYARADGVSLLHLVLIYYVVAHTIFWAEIRNRVYLMPYIILFAAYAVQVVAARRPGARQASPGGGDV